MEAARIEMVQSDAKASKCAKLGLSFEDAYPSDYAAYMAASARYNGYEVEYNALIAVAVDEEEGSGSTSPDITPEELLVRAKKAKLDKISAYDTSSEINSITVGGSQVWVPAAQRAILKTSIEAYKATGATSVAKVWKGIEYTLPVDTWLYMINTVEVYASECFNVTARHKAAVEALTTIADVEAYNYQTGYPQKLIFEV